MSVDRSTCNIIPFINQKVRALCPPRRKSRGNEYCPVELKNRSRKSTSFPVWSKKKEKGWKSQVGFSPTSQRSLPVLVLHSIGSDALAFVSDDG